MTTHKKPTTMPTGDRRATAKSSRGRVALAGIERAERQRRER